MKRLLTLLFTIFFLMVISSNFVPKSSSDELNDITKQISDLTAALNMSINATKPLESELQSLVQQINKIKKRVAAIEQDVALKKKEIGEGYKNLTKQQEVLNRTIRDFYIKSYYNSPLLVFVSAPDASQITQILAYQKAATDQDKVIITNTALSIQNLETKKQSLENEQKQLNSIKVNLDEQSARLDKIVSGAKTYQATLSSQIAQLSAKQQEIIGQRLSGLNIPRSAGTSMPACVDDREKDPGFSPRIAFFTYGVPNRTGLNQYGAKGRASAGQSSETILKAYYNYDELKDVDQNTQIRVDGHPSYSLEEYMKRIYEMPEDWPIEALKAQAIAARSYAMAYTNNGSGSICDSQQCQVFQDNPKTGNWATAVQQTAGKVMVQGGSPIKAWFSSTHGGYVLATSELPSWSATNWTKHATDTTTGTAGSFADLNSNAYDKDSPWFYCDWGSRGQGNTAWLRPSEIADIVNVILLARADSSTKDHFYQTDKPHPYGGEVWNEDRVKQELRSRNITPYNNISDISVSADFGSDKTTSVNVSGDGGSQSFSGSEFKDWFNLRAPANIQIVGPLYNVERR